MPPLVAKAQIFKVTRSRKRWAVARRLLIPPEPCSVKRNVQVDRSDTNV